jgi:hypothetical protein
MVVLSRYAVLWISKMTHSYVLRIRIGFNADPDPAFYLYVDLLSQNKADPDHGLTFNSQKV